MEDYARVHRSRINLWIHIFAVPAFALGLLGSISLLLQGAWLWAAAAAGGVGAALGLQSFGHSHEETAPAPFRGPWDFIRRILVEQFVTFPRFFFGGGWWRALRSSTS